jgi:hypothetical protein
LEEGAGLGSIRVLRAGPLIPLHALDQILAAADDIELVGGATDPVEILLACGRMRAEAVVIPMEGDELPGIATHLLAEYPDVKVLGVTPDASRALLYERHARLTRLDDVPPPGLLDAIRAAVRPEVAQ